MENDKIISEETKIFENFKLRTDEQILKILKENNQIKEELKYLQSQFEKSKVCRINQKLVLFHLTNLI